MNPDQDVRSGVSSTVTINNGLNILERRSIPMMVQYICSTLVVEEENGTFHLIKNVYKDSDIANIISKYNSHSFSSEESALYLTDPNPLIRAIVQNYHSK
jgi:hypothetical protein